MLEPVTYAKAGVTPDNWPFLIIIDHDTGQEVHGVVEVNTVEGWLVRVARNAEGRLIREGESAKTERLAGRFEIRVKGDQDA